MIARLCISLVIGGALFYVLREGGLPVVPSAEAWTQLQSWTLFVFIPLWLIGTYLRVHRWVHLLRPIEPNVSERRVVGVGFLGFAALFAPMRMGEIARPLLIARDRQVGFMQAAGTVVAERIVDGVMLTVILALGMATATPVSPLPDHLGDLALPVALVPAIAKSALLFFLLAFSAMALFYFWRALARRIVFSLVGRVSKPLAGLITAQVERVSDSLSFLLSKRHGYAFLRETLGYWGLSALGFLVLLRGAGAPASFSQACVTMGVLGLSTALPGPPGFYGMYQIGAYCGIAMFFPQLLLTSGVVFTFISYCTQLVTAALSLLLGLWIMSRTERPASAADSGGQLLSAPPSQSPR
jgi:hypothetical protein